MQREQQKEQLSRLQLRVRRQNGLVVELLNRTLFQVEKSASESWQLAADSNPSADSYVEAVRLLQDHLGRLQVLGLHVAEMLRQSSAGLTTLPAMMVNGQPSAAPWLSARKTEGHRSLSGSIDGELSTTNYGSLVVPPIGEGATTSKSSSLSAGFHASDDCALNACRSNGTGSDASYPSFGKGTTAIQPANTEKHLHSHDGEVSVNCSSGIVDSGFGSGKLIQQLPSGGSCSKLVPPVIARRQLCASDVVDVGTPSLFWLRQLPSSREALMSRLSAHMAKNKPKLLTSLPSPGDVVCSLYMDGVWYRAVVLQTDPSASIAEVLYIDYGNVEITDVSFLAILEPAFANESAQAVPCCLAGLLPPENESDWPSTTVALFTSTMQQACTVSSDGSLMVLTAAIDVVLGFPVVVVEDVHGARVESAVEMLLSSGLARRGSAAEYNSWLVRQHGAAFVHSLVAFLPLVKRNEDEVPLACGSDGFKAQRTPTSDVASTQLTTQSMGLANLCRNEGVTVAVQVVTTAGCEVAASTVAEIASAAPAAEATTVAPSAEVIPAIPAADIKTSGTAAKVPSAAPCAEVTAYAPTAEGARAVRVTAAAAEVMAAPAASENDLASSHVAQSNRASSGSNSSALAHGVERNASPAGSDKQCNPESEDEDAVSDVNSLSCVPSSRSEVAGSTHSLERAEGTRNADVRTSIIASDSDKPLVSCGQGVTNNSATSKELPPQDSSSSRVFVVLPSFVISPSEFYVNLVTEESAAALQALEELSQYYASLGTSMLLRYLRDMTSDSAGSRLQIGDFICAICGNAFYRARVEDMLDSKSESAPADLPDIYVFFIDYGNRAWVRSADQVLPLRPKYVDIPPQAVLCRLADIEPADSGDEPNSWSDAAITSMRKLVNVGNTYYAKFHNPVEQLSSFNVDRLQSSPYLVLLAERGSHDIVNDALICLGHARSTSLAATAPPELNAQDSMSGQNCIPDDQHSSSTSSDDEIAELDSWDPLGEDYRSGTNSYKINPDDPEFASTGYLSQRRRICNYFASRGKCYRGNNCHYEHVRHRPGAVTADTEEVPMLRSIEVPYLGVWTCAEVSCIVDPSHFYVVFPFGTQAISVLLDKYPPANSTTAGGTRDCDSMADSLEALQKGLNRKFLSKTGQILGSHRAPITDYAIGEIVAAQFSRDKQMYRARIIESDLDRNEALVFFVDFGNVERVPLSSIRALEPQFLHLPCQAVEASLLVTPFWRSKAPTYSQAAIETFIGLVNGKLLFAHILQRYGNERIEIELCEATPKGDIFITEELIKSGHVKRQVVRGNLKKQPGSGKPSVKTMYFPG